MCEKTIYCEYKPDDRRAIQKAIDSCPAGGKVVVPRGEWKSGPLTLKSNLTLEVAEDCVISFSDCMEDYLPPVFTRWEGVECYNYKPLIYARDCENITITGKGTFFGNGQSWWHWKSCSSRLRLPFARRRARVSNRKSGCLPRGRLPCARLFCS